MDLEWDWVMVHSIRTILLGIILSATIHTATILMVTTHTVPTMVMVVMDITPTVMEWADWVGVVTVMGMDGSEMEMEAVGEVRGTVVKHQMLHIIIADQRL